MTSHTPESTCHPTRDTLLYDDENALVVLGIGNVLWADEGFGVRCVETLQREWTFAPHVDLIDGGTQGLYLIEHVQSATKLLIFDAIDYGLAPGTLMALLALAGVGCCVAMSMPQVHIVAYCADLGYGAALSWVLFALVASLAAISFWSSKYWVFYAGEKDIKR